MLKHDRQAWMLSDAQAMPTYVRTNGRTDEDPTRRHSHLQFCDARARIPKIIEVVRVGPTRQEHPMTATNDQRRQDRAIPDGIAAVREAAKQAKLTARALLNTPNPTLNQIENARRNSR